MATTVQSGIKRFNKSSIMNYGFFLGGVSSKNRDLQNLDPQKLGYVRWFITKMPEFMRYLMPDETKWFKHVLETMFTEINGISDATMDFASITGGLVGNTIEIPTLLSDDTKEISVTVPEQSGSLVREYLTMWLCGIADKQSGYGTYCGLLEPGNNVGNLTYAQCNHTMEAIYVSTDPTGMSTGIEFACLLTNMVPKSIPDSVFTYSSGTVSTNMITIAFTANKYVSADINARAKELVEKYAVVLNSINMSSGYTSRDINEMTDWNLVQ